MMNVLAKLLFPRRDRSPRRTRLRALLLGIFFGLITAVIFGAFICWQSIYKAS